METQRVVETMKNIQEYEARMVGSFSLYEVIQDPACQVPSYKQDHQKHQRAENTMLKKSIERWLSHSLLAKVDVDHGDKEGYNRTLIGLIVESLTVIKGDPSDYILTLEDLKASKDSLEEAARRNEAHLLQVVVNTYVARGAIKFVGELGTEIKGPMCINRVAI